MTSVYLDKLDDQNIATTKHQEDFMTRKMGRIYLSPLIVYGGIKDSLGIKLDWIDSALVGPTSLTTQAFDPNMGCGAPMKRAPWLVFMNTASRSSFRRLMPTEFVTKRERGVYIVDYCQAI